MYRGFNIENLPDDYFFTEDNSVDNFLTDSYIVSKNRKKYCSMKGYLNASAIQEDWFPQRNFDIFISHSHDDESLAKAFAWWLQKTFDLKVFIDSAVWGYFRTLLKGIHRSKGLPNADSHAHMMLNMALMNMIDRTECLFFLNTPQSINLDEEFNTGTYSPWLYTEIGISRMIKKKLPARYESFSEENAQEKKLLENAKIWYKTDISHLTTLNADDLKSWASHCQKTFEHPLDVLYDLYPLEKSIK